MEYTSFRAFFKEATGGYDPYPYQEQLAQATEMPPVWLLPTGSGKTAAAILSWLWRRRFHPDRHVRAQTPRRLVYCLPMRVLVEQTHRTAGMYLRNLALLDRPDQEAVGLALLMGGEVDRDWVLSPEQDAILVGTQEMLLSRALNRGYAASRYRWPLEFGLLHSDVLWIMDEVQLMGNGLPNSVQLDAFRKRFGTYGPTRSIWLSATLDPAWLTTVDHKEPPGPVLRLGAADLAAPALRRRLEAPKTLRQLSGLTPGAKDYPEVLAAAVLQQHRPGTQTLVVVNTVERAQAVFRALATTLTEFAPGSGKVPGGRRRPKAQPGVPVEQGSGAGTEVEDGAGQEGSTAPDLLLVHSRFRGADRQRLNERLYEEPRSRAGRIIVATQVVEAGVDISARTLITELAPWAALVQRFGRCNRFGEHADGDVLWVDVPTTGESGRLAQPYDPADLDDARARLLAAPDPRPVALLQSSLPPLRDVPMVLRTRDLLGLFDTAPDLSGNDLDVSRFIRGVDDVDVQVFWREWEGPQPPSDLPPPQREELCPTPVGSLRTFLKNHPGWRWDHLVGEWRRLQPEEVRPGLVLLLSADDGGYDPILGWWPAADGKVPPLPPGHVSAQARQAAREEPYGDDPGTAGGGWVTLAEHSDAVAEELERLLQRLPPLPAQAVQALRTAARWHDAGKSHPVFQSTLLERLAGPEREHMANAIWAKAPHGHIRHARPHLRHELASALALLQHHPSGSVTDLAAYLVASHHGKARLGIRAQPGEALPPEPGRRFVLGIWEGDELPATPLGGGVTMPATRLSLGVLELGQDETGAPSWVERVLALLESREHGPFRLAFLEALLRVADSRASARPQGR